MAQNEEIDDPIRILCLDCRKWWDSDYDPVGCECDSEDVTWIIVDPELSDEVFNDLLWMHGLVEELESHVHVRK